MDAHHLDAHHLDIVALAWSRELGLPDGALREAGTRSIRVDDAAVRVRIVLLGAASAVVGPRWAIERAADLSDEVLVSRGALLALTKDHAGRGAAPSTLFYASDFCREFGADQPLISHELTHVLELQRRCPPDDVDEADLAAKRNWFTLVDDEHRPLASAGYAELQGILADMGVLTVPHHRRRGFGTTVATLATNDALDGGLIPQWRAHRDNTASRRLAARLGFVECGTLTAVGVSASTVWGISDGVD